MQCSLSLYVYTVNIIWSSGIVSLTFFHNVIVGLLWVISQPYVINIWYSVYMCNKNLLLRVHKLQEINILSMWAKKIWYSVYMYRENRIFCLQVWRKSDLVYLLSRKSYILYIRVVRIWYSFYTCRENILRVHILLQEKGWKLLAVN
jgi:hypothetical protein